MHDPGEHDSHIIESDVTFIRDRVDRFYKVDSKVPHPLHTRSGADRLSQARPEVEALRRLLYAKHSEWIEAQGGGFTLDAQVTVGNCTEMALAAVDCCLKSPRLARKFRPCFSHPDASHTFVLLSDKDVSNHRT